MNDPAFFDEDDKVKTYRGRAKHARLSADDTPSPNLKEILQKLASLYDAKADAIERVENEKPTE